MAHCAGPDGSNFIAGSISTDFRKRMKMRKNIIHIITAFLIVLWVYAAVSKLADYRLFVEQLKQQPLPKWSALLLSRVLPVCEITTALLLSFERTRNYGMAASWMMLICFTVYTGLALSGAYGTIPCSCGGIFYFLHWNGHLIFNATAGAAAFFGWRIQRKEIGITGILKRKYYAHTGKQAENPRTE